MKLSLRTLLLAGLLTLGVNSLAGELKVGATPVPHAELLNLVKDDLKAQGVDLKVIEFTDYVTPNLSLADGEIDANYFQHYPYLEKFASERNLKLVSAAKIHVEPLGVCNLPVLPHLRDGSGHRSVLSFRSPAPDFPVFHAYH